MSTSTASSLTAGALFGTALLCSGVYQPLVITAQFTLANFHMVQTFVAASCASAVVVRVAQSAGFASCPAQAPASAYNGILGGVFRPYDANVLGGLLVGAGMALTGACPGTVLVQMATGVRSGAIVGLGGLLGGIFFTGYNARQERKAEQQSSQKELGQGQNAEQQSPQEELLLEKSTAPSTSTSTSTSTYTSTQDISSPAPTLAGMLKSSPATAFLVYEVLLLATLVASSTLLPPSRQGSHWLQPLAGGLLIGMTQASSVLLTRKTVAVSRAYFDLGRWVWRRLTHGRCYAHATLRTPSLAFASGIVLGSGALARSAQFHALSAGAESPAPLAIGPLRALVGGSMLALGAGLAGGCPSGHGISGMATLGVASFVSVACMFGGAMAVAWALGGT